MFQLYCDNSRQEAYFLAIVEVGGEKTRTVYLKDPFHKSLEKIIASANYKPMDLIRGAESVSGI